MLILIGQETSILVFSISTFDQPFQQLGKSQEFYCLILTSNKKQIKRDSCLFNIYGRSSQCQGFITFPPRESLQRRGLLGNVTSGVFLFNLKTEKKEKEPIKDTAAHCVFSFICRRRLVL